MNDEIKEWYKEAKRKCQIAYNKYEASGYAEEEYIPYLEAMEEIASYYIHACDFDRESFRPDW